MILLYHALDKTDKTRGDLYTANFNGQKFHIICHDGVIAIIASEDFSNELFIDGIGGAYFNGKHINHNSLPYLLTKMCDILL